MLFSSIYAKKSSTFDLLPHINGDPFEGTFALCGIYASERLFFRKRINLHFMPEDVFSMQASKAILVYKIIE